MHRSSNGHPTRIELISVAIAAGVLLIAILTFLWPKMFSEDEAPSVNVAAELLEPRVSATIEQPLMITVENDGNVTLANVQVMLFLPSTLTFVDNTLVRQGPSGSDRKELADFYIHNGEAIPVGTLPEEEAVEFYLDTEVDQASADASTVEIRIEVRAEQFSNPRPYGAELAVRIPTTSTATIEYVPTSMATPAPTLVPSPTAESMETITATLTPTQGATVTTSAVHREEPLGTSEPQVPSEEISSEPRYLHPVPTVWALPDEIVVWHSVPLPDGSVGEYVDTTQYVKTSPPVGQVAVYGYAVAGGEVYIWIELTNLTDRAAAAQVTLYGVPGISFVAAACYESPYYSHRMDDEGSLALGTTSLHPGEGRLFKVVARVDGNVSTGHQFDVPMAFSVGSDIHEAIVPVSIYDRADLLFYNDRGTIAIDCN